MQAIYFPQFTPCKTNDISWGKEFTDWHLVSAANAFNLWDRRAPRRGFYDTRDTATILAQLQEALSSNLDGFALYHYHFDDGPELGHVEEVLFSQRLTVSHASFLIWASEEWTKRWIGQQNTIRALSREPSNSFIERHCVRLGEAFSSSNYLKIDGRPLFAIYNATYFKYSQQVIRRYRSAFDRLGWNPIIVSIASRPQQILPEFDGVYFFEPRLFFNLKQQTASRHLMNVSRIVDNLPNGAKNVVKRLYDLRVNSGRVYPYRDFVEHVQSNIYESLSSHGIMAGSVLTPGWNNAPRYRDRFTCLKDASEAEFKSVLRAERYLRMSKRNFSLPTLINAWNEWSEGSAIEPCEYLGNRYLDAIKLSGQSNQ